tara:strand:- start:66 stop:539 length:474 start_codon:yes stop_codon:yes gene_type:complete
MKKLVRKWLGIDEEVKLLYALTNENANLKKQLSILDASYCELDEKVNNIESDTESQLSSLEYEIEERVSRWDVEDMIRDEAITPDNIDEQIDYEQIYDNVFDLVMREIESRDTLKELVSAEVESFTSTTEAQGYPVDVDINEIVEEVIEAVVIKLQS